MFKTLAVASLSVSAAVQTNDFYESKFFDWMQEHKIQFKNGAEFAYRLSVFRENLDYIMNHNAKESTYELGTNAYSHLTSEEFADFFHLGSLRPPMLRRSTEFVHSAPSDLSSLPASVDWTTVPNVVTPVKDQGNCGSCWSFSATGAIEGAYGIKYQQQAYSKGFSEQELVSCDTTDAGCNGGWMDDAFAWAQKNGGLPTEQDYPYTSGTSGQSGSCQKTGHVMIAASTPSGYVDVKTKDVNAMMAAVAQQPVSIAIQANQKDFQNYKSGVLTGTCGQRLDHGVLNVGYGVYTDAAQTPYWKVKNSWGTSWGMQGYILIERSSADKCGVLDAGSYPTL
jgi:KDEL-tailed cysteine endopeptidase